MRAMLVIEMPDMCNECPMCSAETGFLGDITRSECRIANRDNMVYLDGMAVPVWCPLKPLPEPKEIEFEWLEGEYENGWNDCLKEIEK